MYKLGVVKTLIARHFLIGGDWGAENFLHSHQYRFELVLYANKLDGHGYLIDLDVLHEIVNEKVARFRDKVLNECREFADLNPSVEHFSRILCEQIFADLKERGNHHVDKCEVTLWENDCGFASYVL